MEQEKGLAEWDGRKECWGDDLQGESGVQFAAGPQDSESFFGLSAALGSTHETKPQPSIKDCVTRILPRKTPRRDISNAIHLGSYAMTKTEAVAQTVRNPAAGGAPAQNTQITLRVWQAPGSIPGGGIQKDEGIFLSGNCWTAPKGLDTLWQSVYSRGRECTAGYANHISSAAGSRFESAQGNGGPVRVFLLDMAGEGEGAADRWYLGGLDAVAWKSNSLSVLGIKLGGSGFGEKQGKYGKECGSDGNVTMRQMFSHRPDTLNLTMETAIDKAELLTSLKAMQRNIHEIYFLIDREDDVLLTTKFSTLRSTIESGTTLPLLQPSLERGLDEAVRRGLERSHTVWRFILEDGSIWKQDQIPEIIAHAPTRDGTFKDILWHPWTTERWIKGGIRMADELKLEWVYGTRMVEDEDSDNDNDEKVLTEGEGSDDDDDVTTTGEVEKKGCLDEDAYMKRGWAWIKSLLPQISVYSGGRECTAGYAKHIASAECGRSAGGYRVTGGGVEVDLGRAGSVFGAKQGKCGREVRGQGSVARDGVTVTSQFNLPPVVSHEAGRIGDFCRCPSIRLSFVQGDEDLACNPVMPYHVFCLTPLCASNYHSPGWTVGRPAQHHTAAERERVKQLRKISRIPDLAEQCLAHVPQSYYKDLRGDLYTVFRRIRVYDANLQTDVDAVEIKAGYSSDTPRRQQEYRDTCQGVDFDWKFKYTSDNVKRLVLKRGAERLVHLSLRMLGAGIPACPCPGCGVRHKEFFAVAAAGGIEGLCGIIEFWLGLLGEPVNKQWTVPRYGLYIAVEYDTRGLLGLIQAAPYNLAATSWLEDIPPRSSTHALGAVPGGSRPNRLNEHLVLDRLEGSVARLSRAVVGAVEVNGLLLSRGARPERLDTDPTKHQCEKSTVYCGEPYGTTKCPKRNGLKARDKYQLWERRRFDWGSVHKFSASFFLSVRWRRHLQPTVYIWNENKAFLADWRFPSGL
ncbi:hypothetical protein B0H16DRAFT_1478723 [Mycena metata]|uniref:Bacteriophage T5 Orf172 DNA-binding domain-containing protein n=1 Tax=Mycena metata TaxID=1033252 RepID=A0AAD7H664_9AGAR|nr:hypothetical protein B0H16DRAFT_1478723 [Mycena metata]